MYSTGTRGTPQGPRDTTQGTRGTTQGPRGTTQDTRGTTQGRTVESWRTLRQIANKLLLQHPLIRSAPFIIAVRVAHDG